MISSKPISPEATSGTMTSTCLAEDAVETVEGCAWAIEKEGRLVGRIDVLHDGPRVARIRWLSIDPTWYRTAAVSRLVDMARRYCSEHGPRRLLAEAGSAPGWVLAMLRRRGIPVVRSKPLTELIPSQPDAGWREPSPVEDCVPAGHSG
jgi:N-acetylglutamate synthase-like GNAT family acetyltransferase